MSEIYQLPDNNGGNNGTNIPFSIPIGLGGFGNGGFGSSSTGTDYLKKTLDEKDFKTIEGKNKAE